MSALSLVVCELMVAPPHCGGGPKIDRGGQKNWARFARHLAPPDQNSETAPDYDYFKHLN